MRKNPLRFGAVVWLLRLPLAVAFIYGGLSKIASPGHFISAVSDYGLFPLANPTAAHIVGLVETFLGYCLLFCVGGQRMIAATTILLVGFATLMFWNLIKGRPIRECGCFPNSGPLTWRTLARDLALLACSVQLLVLNRPLKETSGGTPDSP